MKEDDFWKSSLNIVSIPVFRLILIVFFLVSTFLLVLQYYFVFPAFNRMQKNHIESEAERTANHLVSAFIAPGTSGELQVDASIIRDLNVALRDFEIKKIKLFTAEGRVLHSSDEPEIGTINTKPYFQKIVSAGGIYSQIVEKDQQTAEGNLTHVSVAEVYIPVIKNNLITTNLQLASIDAEE